MRLDLRSPASCSAVARPGALALVLPLFGLLLCAAPLHAQRAHLPTDPGPAPRALYDVRLDVDLVRPEVTAAIAAARSPTAASARTAALAALSAAVPELRLDQDEFFGTPHFLRSTRALLSAPVGGAFTPLQVVADFVEAQRALFEVRGSDVLRGRVVRDFLTRHNGIQHLTVQQQEGGLDVFGAELKASVSRLGELVTIGSTLLPRPAGGFQPPAMRIAPETAILLAAAHVGIALSTTPVPAPDGLLDARGRPLGAALGQGAGAAQLWLPSPDFRADTPVTTTLQLFPLDRLNLHPAWLVVVPEPGVGNTYEVHVDATDGTILRADNRLKYLLGGSQNASYRVYTGDSPAPGSPGNATPNGFQFPFVPRSLVTLAATAGSPQGWIPDGANETLGNNCDAHLDLNFDNLPDLPRPAGSPFRVFDFPLDPNQAPSTYRNAAVTQMFYFTNRIHDVLYGFGFDEAASNFQTDNFGLGGVGGDAVSADCQDGSGTNNANWNGDGNDGSFTWIQMYVFDGPTPDRDGDLDGDIVYHEYCHGLSYRLSGGTVSGEQSGGMGEGWGDFFGVCMSAEPGDDPAANYAMGGYATKDFFGETENYYFGIRRYPYSSNLAKSPLTYADADPAQMVIPGGIPVNTLFSSNPADEVHNVGEMWCQALLECRTALWNGGLGFAANDLIMQLAVDGMKLMPSNPNMLEARDGILAADIAGHGGIHLGELWAGFAKRGMGDSASSPSGSTTTGIVEAFDIPTLILFDYPSGTPGQLSPGVVTHVPVAVSGLGGDAPLPGTGMLHYSVNGGAFVHVAMTPTGVDTYDAALPALACFDELSWYTSVDSTGGVVNSPSQAPADTHDSTVFTGTAVLSSDDFEAASAWTVGAPGDTATTGIWVRGDPIGTGAQSEDDHTPGGVNCWFTGQGPIGGGLGDNDVDGGRTTLTSTTFNLSGGDANIGYWLWYSNTTGAAPNADVFRVEVSANNGGSWVPAQTIGPTGPDTSGGWSFHQFAVGDFVVPTASVRVRFIAADEADGSLVEAMLDDVQVTRTLCDPGTVCATDLGFGGPGSLSLSLCGQPLLSGNSATMLLTGADPGALVYLLGGVFNTPTPFAGGTLVPIPILVTLLRVADGTGTVSLLVPGGGGPVQVYVQAASPDAGVFGGYALSNAIEASVGP